MGTVVNNAVSSRAPVATVPVNGKGADSVIDRPEWLTGEKVDQFLDSSFADLEILFAGNSAALAMVEILKLSAGQMKFYKDSRELQMKDLLVAFQEKKHAAQDERDAARNAFIFSCFGFAVGVGFTGFQMYQLRGMHSPSKNPDKHGVANLEASKPSSVSGQGSQPSSLQRQSSQAEPKHGDNTKPKKTERDQPDAEVGNNSGKPKEDQEANAKKQDDYETQQKQRDNQQDILRGQRLEEEKNLSQNQLKIQYAQAFGFLAQQFGPFFNSAGEFAASGERASVTEHNAVADHFQQTAGIHGSVADQYLQVYQGGIQIVSSGSNAAVELPVSG